MGDHGNVYAPEGDEEFELLLESAEDKLVAVDFFATWCGPCKMISPFFAQLSLQYPEAIYLQVDVDKLKGTAMKYGIRAMPTFGFFKNKTLIKSFTGANSSQLQQVLTSLISSSSSNISSYSTPAQTKYTSFPLETYAYWDSGKLDVISDKIVQISTKMAQNESTKEHSLSPSETNAFKKMIQTLSQFNQYHASNFSQEEYIVIMKLLKWPASDRFPALDVLRLMVLHPEGANQFSKSGVLQTILQFLKEKDSPFAVHLMSLRYIANSFRYEATRRLTISCLDQVIGVLVEYQRHDNKTVRNAVCSVLLNASVLFGSTNEYKNEKNRVWKIILYLLQTETDEDSQYKLVAAAGTMGCTDAELRKELQSSRSIIQSMKPQNKKIQDSVNELLSLASTPSASASSSTPSPVSSAPAIPLLTPPSAAGVPGNAQLDMNLFQKIQSSPDILQAMQNPQLMMKLQEIMANPTKMMEYQGDAEVMKLLQAMFSVMNG